VHRKDKTHISSKLRSVDKLNKLEFDEKCRLWDEVRYAILEDIANCIVRMFSEKYIRAIYFIDLSGEEVAREGFGRDIDLIIEVCIDY